MEEKYRGLKYKVGLKMYHHIALYSYVSVDDDNECTISISYDGSFYLFAPENGYNISSLVSGQHLISLCIKYTREDAQSTIGQHQKYHGYE